MDGSELAFVLRNKGNVHKWNAYTKAAKVLKNLSTKVKSGAEAIKLDGIGEKMATEVDEILKSGKLEKLERELSTENIDVVNQLSRIAGTTFLRMFFFILFTLCLKQELVPLTRASLCMNLEFEIWKI